MPKAITLYKADTKGDLVILHEIRAIERERSYLLNPDDAARAHLTARILNKGRLGLLGRTPLEALNLYIGLAQDVIGHLAHRLERARDFLHQAQALSVPYGGQEPGEAGQEAEGAGPDLGAAPILPFADEADWPEGDE